MQIAHNSLVKPLLFCTRIERTQSDGSAHVHVCIRVVDMKKTQVLFGKARLRPNAHGHFRESL